MSYKVKPLKVFERQAKRLIGRYPSLRKELVELGARLEKEPE